MEPGRETVYRHLGEVRVPAEIAFELRQLRVITVSARALPSSIAEVSCCKVSSTSCAGAICNTIMRNRACVACRSWT